MRFLGSGSKAGAEKEEEETKVGTHVSHHEYYLCIFDVTKDVMIHP